MALSESESLTKTSISPFICESAVALASSDSSLLTSMNTLATVNPLAMLFSLSTVSLSSGAVTSTPLETSAVPSTLSTMAATSLAMRSNVSKSLPFISIEMPLPVIAPMFMSVPETLSSYASLEATAMIFETTSSVERSRSSMSDTYKLAVAPPPSPLNPPIPNMPPPTDAPTLSTSPNSRICAATSSAVIVKSLKLLPAGSVKVTLICPESVGGKSWVPMFRAP